MKKVTSLLICCFLMVGCAMRADDGTDDDDGGPSQPNGPGGPSTPNPPDGDIADGTVHCAESGGNTIVKIRGLLSRLHDANLTPGANWKVTFGYGGTDSRAWSSDTATYALTMLGTVDRFGLLLEEPNGGTKHWVDVTKFNVTGTCSRDGNEFRHASTGGGGGGGTGSGSIVCSENGGTTTVVVTGPLIANVFENANLSASSSPRLHFGYGGSMSHQWIGDTAAYTMTMPGSVTGFNFYLLGSNGQQHWFDTSKFNVSGTCSKVSTEFRHTSTGGGGGGGTGYGSLHCAENGGNTTVTLTGPLVANVFNNTNLSPNSGTQIRFGYGISGSYSWVSDSATYTLTMPGSTTGFNLYLLNGGTEHWFNVNQFNVSGTCSKVSNEFRHTSTGGGGGGTYGQVWCSENGSSTNVTVSNGILEHLNVSGLSPNSNWTLRLSHSGGTDIRSWNSDGSSYPFSMTGTTVDFSIVLRDPNGNTYPFDVSEFDVGGTCYKQSNQFRHTPQSGGGSNGQVNCSESGSSTNVTISNGILAHLGVSGLSPNSNWTVRFGYGGGSDSRSWNGDFASYTLSMPGTVTAFGLILRDPNGNEYAFDTSEFDTFGSCYKQSNEFRHTPQGGGNGGFGTIHCSISGPDMTVAISGGVLDHVVGGTINPTSSWKIQYGATQPVFDWQVPYAAGVSKPQLSWVNNSTTYTFTLASSVNGFNFALTDGISPYWFDLAEFNVTGNCFLSGGSIRHN